MGTLKSYLDIPSVGNPSVDDATFHRLKKLSQLLAVQVITTDKYPYDEYQTGLANGLILSIATMLNDVSPPFIIPPPLPYYPTIVPGSDPLADVPRPSDRAPGIKTDKRFIRV